MGKGLATETPPVAGEDVVAEGDYPPNLALAYVLYREWYPAAVAVCGEAERCEA